jgi:hypothetical protein
MKVYALALISALAFVGCTHKSDTVVPTAGKLTVTPKSGGGTGSSPATPVAGGDWGTTNGQKGGPCKQEIVQAYQAVMATCQDPDQMSKCASNMQKFGDKYPNVSCSTTSDGAVVGIDTTGASGKSASGQQSSSTPAVATGAKCDAKFAADYTETDGFCSGLDDDSSTNEWRQCQQLAHLFINTYSDQDCVLPNGNFASWSTIQGEESSAYAQIQMSSF